MLNWVPGVQWRAPDLWELVVEQRASYNPGHKTLKHPNSAVQCWALIKSLLTVSILTWGS